MKKIFTRKRSIIGIIVLVVLAVVLTITLRSCDKQDNSDYNDFGNTTNNVSETEAPPVTEPEETETTTSAEDTEPAETEATVSEDANADADPNATTANADAADTEDNIDADDPNANIAADQDVESALADKEAAMSAMMQFGIDNGLITEAMANDPQFRQQFAAFYADTVEIESEVDASAPVDQLLQNSFIVDKETRELLETVFSKPSAGTNYDDILFLPETSDKGVTVTITEGQVLYLSAGIYQLIAPNGELYTRFFGEETVSNDYYFLPGTYQIFGYPTPTTLERGKFAAIGGKIFKSAPSMLLELQDSYARALDMHVVGTSLQQASYDGMAKKASYSRFVLMLDKDGNDPSFQTKATTTAGKVQVTQVEFTK